MEDGKTVYVTFEFQSNADQEVGRITGKMQMLDTEASRAFKSMTEGSSLASRGISAQSEALSHLPAPLKAATAGFGSLIKSAMAFIATPVGAILAAIVVALKALTAWFSSSADGQMEFAKVSGYVSGVLGQLKEILIKVGEWLYKAFSDPKKAVKELWEAIKENIVNRIQGVGEMFKALGKIISSGFTEGFDELKNASLKAATGVDDLEKKVLAYVDGVHQAAKATSDLRVAEEQLSRDRSEWTKRKAEIEVEAEELRTAMYAASDAERIKIAEKYEKVIGEKYAKEIGFLEEELRIKKELGALTSDTQQEIDEINQLEASLIRLRAEQIREMRPMDRQTARIERALPEKDNTEKLLEQQKKYHASWEKAELDFQQRQIDLLDDSFYKQQKQIELNNLKSLEEISRQEEEILKAKRDAWGASVTLSDDEKSYFERLRGLVSEEYTKEINELRESIDDAFSEGRLLFADELTIQLADIENYYRARIRQAEGNEELIKQLTINKEKEIALARNVYHQQMLKSDLELSKKRIENAQRQYKFIADRREVELKAEKKAVEERIRLLEQQYEITPFEDLKNEIESARIELEKFNRELENIPRERASETAAAFAQITGALGGIGGELGQTFSSLSGSMSSLSESFSADTSTMEGQAGAIGTAISNIVGMIDLCISATQRRKAAEKEFYMNSIAFAHEYALALNEQNRLQSTGNKFVKDYSGQINDAFVSLADANEKYNEALSKLSEGKAKVDLRDSVDWNATLKSTGMGAAAGAAIGSVIPVIGTAVGAVVGAAVGFFTGLFGGKKKTDVKSGLLDVFPELVTAAGELNRELAQSLIATEQVDKETAQLLQNALDWADAVEAAREQILDITSELAGDIGNNLRNAIVEAWKAGEPAAQRMFDAASKSLENFVTNLLYSTIFSDIFEEFGNRLADSLDPVHGDNDILDDYEWLMREMQARDDLFVQYLDALKTRAQDLGFKGFGELDSSGDGSTRKAASLALQGVTQDSVNEMNGRLTALLIYQDSLLLAVGGINTQLASGLTILRDIEKNTAYCRHLEQMQKDMALMKTDLSTMNSRGVLMRTA